LVSQQHQINVRFYPPPEDLRRYFTTFYVTDIDPGPDGVLHDSLHPEWAGMRFFTPTGPTSWTDAGQRLENVRFLTQGPSSHPIHFAMPKTRLWGFGFLPLGWAKFVRMPAAEFANYMCDGYQRAECAPFRPLADALFQEPIDEEAELQRIIDFFRNFPAKDPVDQNRILAIHAALVDPQVATVQQLVARVAASQRTVERISYKHFGFSPKLLLRRQRFMRSLAQFMLDPTLKWIGAMDSHYHDQAQFVRDFREFMGVSPREYSSKPHPVLERFTQERNKALASAVQTLDRPGGTSDKAA
jgi:AraC-like DNA-binding protein